MNTVTVAGRILLSSEASPLLVANSETIANAPREDSGAIAQNPSVGLGNPEAGYISDSSELSD